MEHVAARLARLEVAITEAVAQMPPERAALVRALQALRGVATVTAVTVVAEIGDLTRFPNPRHLMAYAGVVPSERSSGAHRRQGGITKTGNAHLRRVIGEAAWAYRYRPAVRAPLRARHTDLDPAVVAIAWKAQHRLHHRYRQMTARGKPHNQVVTAVGRELLGFMWAIARELAPPRAAA